MKKIIEVLKRIFNFLIKKKKGPCCSGSISLPEKNTDLPSGYDDSGYGINSDSGYGSNP